MKIVADHGWPIASYGDDENAFDAFKNERDYIAQGGRLKTTTAAMDWAIREIERLRAEPDAIAGEARRYAGFYPQSSDGRNTFILLAEWIEARAAGEKSTQQRKIVNDRN